ncbi:Major facilitator superfamily domain, general substrate transporter [Penicillium italicum]|uniref:Major facilitator superfamily domain, general substrate transporter n=1 Tax=Penicillium italicum TaxID=40296 RepID=A0A0A2KH97_PENIT|nr:Major facilitator superfamily domain, general substrate transporter [Penicillium italicum]
MKNLVKQIRFPALEEVLEYVQDVAETSGRWVHWQIIRGKRHIWWETDWDVVSRWAQSIIETEQRLRETTQRENFLKKWIHTFHSGSDEAGKFVLPDLIEDLIALDQEYVRLERIYDTLLAGCPVGPIKDGYMWIRKQPQWYLKIYHAYHAHHLLFKIKPSTMENDTNQDETIWAPGTVRLEDAPVHQSRDQLVLFPTPSSDPNDPLNWSTARKALNFTLVSFFVLWTFVQIDIGFTAWSVMQSELNYSVNTLNANAAINYGGLAIGCIFFMPLVHKYGRRPVYIFSAALQFAACIWQAKMSTVGDLLGSGLISGIGGAISEIVVQITIADMFFVHQHATMNGWFVIVQSTGAFLGPVASGYIVLAQGWRWMWWWCVIFFGVTLLCVLFLFEESKYVPVLSGRAVTTETQLPGEPSKSHLDGDVVDAKNASETFATRVHTNQDIPLKTYSQRMALVTPTNEAIWPHFYQPIVALFTFPAVSYAAITYGTTLCWFAIMTSLQASYMILPPYNFDAAGVGLMNVAPFVGAALGFSFGGHLSDKSILWLSKRNGGIYEPEMRLWLALPIAITSPAGILMFGLGLAYGMHWALLAVGFGFFGFSIAAVGGITLSYLMDCYQDIIGDALIGVIFMRNILSVIVLFVLTPWVNGMGMKNLHILIAVIAFVIQLAPIPLLIWGKKARIATAPSYRKMAANQLSHRTI